MPRPGARASACFNLRSDAAVSNPRCPSIQMGCFQKPLALRTALGAARSRPPTSTNGDQRSHLVPAVGFPNPALRARIQAWLAVHQEQIPMVSVGQFQPRHPPAIGHSSHGMGRGIPIVEIADQGDTLGARGIAKKHDGMGRPPLG